MSEKEDDGEEGGTYRAKERKQSRRSTVVDDQFFKLSEMSKFLDLEDQRENKRRQQEDEQNREGMMTFITDIFTFFNSAVDTISLLLAFGPSGFGYVIILYGSASRSGSFHPQTKKVSKVL
jgi:hypothetical protein